ncbi:hypothetical protein GGR57DRAFT_520380 [Xylariaceae sp. FL1272]|nr:hypothetical protein GGR57DRAFT_520380 [Xylariaceae sp. FL1272]
MLATPSRFVHVKEETENEDEFYEMIRTTPVQLKLHPNLSYFAHNWRTLLPFFLHGRSSRQSTLDEFGFSGPQRYSVPGDPKDASPSIPHWLLANNADIAWEFVRSGFLYSNAPIPVMLQVSRESRQVLIGHGYELAFCTRTHGPRIWFHFERDILYVPLSPYPSERPSVALLSGDEHYDIGQYDPTDLKRVRRLALQASCDVLEIKSRDSTEGQVLHSIMRLFPQLDELFLEEGNPSSFDIWWGKPKYGVTHLPEEADILLWDQGHCPVSSQGYHNWRLQKYINEHVGVRMDFFHHLSTQYERKLSDRLKDTLAPKNATGLDKSTSLPHGELALASKVPRIRIVHICYPWVCERLFQKRWDMWHRFLEDKGGEARLAAIKEALDEVSTIPSSREWFHDPDPLRPPSPFTERYSDDYEVLMGEIAQEIYNYADYEDSERGEYRRRLQLDLLPPDNSQQCE